MIVTRNDLLMAANMQVSALRHDVLRLYAIARCTQAKRMVELGVDCGASTRAMMLALQENGGESLVSVDKRPECCGILKGHPQWSFIVGDTCSQSTVKKCGIDYPVPLLFIDTSHEYEQTIFELPIWLPLLPSGGVAVFHDVKTFKAGVEVPLLEYIAKTGEEKWFYYTYPKSIHGLGVLIRQ